MSLGRGVSGGQELLREHRVVAIDGPVASGKTTVGKMVAERLGYQFVDTGLMYRAVTWAALDQGIDPRDAEQLGELAFKLDLTLRGQEVLVDGFDVTAHVRSAAVEEAVSLVSAVPGVRLAMVAEQRRMAEQGGLVMVGRDIGTKVLVNALVKVYLDASLEERALRRHREQNAAGRSVSLREVSRSLARRDMLDTQRADSPLHPAGDAVLVQTDQLDLEGVVQRVLELVGE
jgi:cytidylate kinase